MPFYIDLQLVESAFYRTVYRRGNTLTLPFDSNTSYRHLCTHNVICTVQIRYRIFDLIDSLVPDTLMVCKRCFYASTIYYD